MSRAPASRELRNSSKRASSTKRKRPRLLRRSPSVLTKRAKPRPKSLYGPSKVSLLASVLDSAALTDDGHPDLAGVLELVFYIFGDVEGKLGSDPVVHLGGLHHDPDLAPRLDGISLVDSPVTERDVLQSP